MGDPNHNPFPRMASKPAKTWVFTLNNWTPLELENVLHWDVTRLVVGEEVGEEGTPHLQGAVTFKRAMRLSALKKLLARAHWEEALTLDCFNYAGKDGNVVHRVDNRTQGKRRDIDAAYEAVAAKKPVREFILERPSLQAIKVFEIATRLLAEERTPPFTPLDVRWYYGPTGSGKSFSAYVEFPGLYKAFDSKWWDGYVGQKCVLLDDFRPSFCKWEYLLQLLDMYPLTLQVKGGSVSAVFTTVIITAPESPSDMFAHYGGAERDNIAQLLRRITSIRRFTGVRGVDGVFGFVQE